MSWTDYGVLPADRLSTNIVFERERETGAMPPVPTAAMVLRQGKSRTVAGNGNDVDGVEVARSFALYRCLSFRIQAVIEAKEAREAIETIPYMLSTGSSRTSSIALRSEEHGSDIVMLRRLWEMLRTALKSDTREPDPETGTQPGMQVGAPAFVWKAGLYKPFFDHVLAPLPPAEKDKVWRHFQLHCEDLEGVPNALHEACMELDAKEHWIFMQVDWKATDEIEWQANAIARTHGLRDAFQLPEDFESAGMVDDGLRAFDRWLQQRDYKFVSYDPGHDAYYGFISKKEDVDSLIAFATSDELDLKRSIP